MPIKLSKLNKTQKIVLMAVGLAVAMILVLALANKKSVQTETFKNKKHNYKVEVPAGFQPQINDAGVLTLTDQTKGEAGTGCIVNILEPMEIEKNYNLEQWAREYRDRQEEKYDYAIISLTKEEWGRYDEGVKMEFKNSPKRELEWYFMRDGRRVFVYEVWKYRESGKECGEWVREIIQ